MLNPEEAREALKGFRAENVAAWRVNVVARMPSASREVGRVLLGLEQGMPGVPAGDWVTSVSRMATHLDSLTPTERLRFFEALFPRLVPYLELAWEMGARLPYQMHGSRRAFRAPHTPQASQLARGSWLQRLAGALAGYDPDIVWLPTWAPHLGYGVDDLLGRLLAAAIDAGEPGGAAVFDLLVASASGEHAIGAMGRHVARALLTAARPEGWEFVEKLLLAAQREEGLRQVILESVDEAHPEAFRRMLRLILDHDLARFSATVRALNVWLGFQWDAVSVRQVNTTLQRLVRFLEDPAARDQALSTGEAEATYLALWTAAFEDAVATVPHAAWLLADQEVERRFVAAHLLAQLDLVDAQAALVPALEDADPRVVCRALLALRHADRGLASSDLFERLEPVIERFPREKKALEAIVWPWFDLTAERSLVAGGLLHNLGGRPPARLVRYLPAMTPDDRREVAGKLAGAKEWDAETRATLLALVGDPAYQVREPALAALSDCRVSEAEAPHLEGYLARKAGDLRRGVLALLLSQPDALSVASAQRLLVAGSFPQRLGGLELLRQMVAANRLVPLCREIAAGYRDGRPRLEEEEARQLEAILGEARKVATLDDALGLMDPARRTRPAAPVRRAVSLGVTAAKACLEALDEQVHAHRETPLTVETWQGPREVLLGDLEGGFPQPQAGRGGEVDVVRLPLRDVWEGWWRDRPAALRDADGFELLRAAAAYPRFWGVWRRVEQVPWRQRLLRTLFGDLGALRLRYPHTVLAVVEWLLHLQPPVGGADFLLDAVETTFALIPAKERTRVADPNNWLDDDWRNDYGLPLGYLQLARLHRALCPTSWTGTHHNHLWRLLRWRDEPLAVAGAHGNRIWRLLRWRDKPLAVEEAGGAPAATRVPRHRAQLSDLLPAYAAGGATDADLFDHLLGPQEPRPWGGVADLRSLSGRKATMPELTRFPFLPAFVERCRERIIAVEVERGDTPTAASQPALALRYAGGLDVLARVLPALGRESFLRSWSFDSLSRASVFSHLVRATFPAAADTHEAFAARMRAAKIPPGRLVELALYTPQWAGHIEHALSWEGFASGVWWIHAHTKDEAWRVDADIRDTWAAEVHEYTPLSGQDLLDGAVDVAWFQRVFAALGEERWQALDAAARYASGGGGHKRAQLFADAMLGRVTRDALVARITTKRHQDAVRALGLLPLSSRSAREADLLERYRLLQEFIRGSRQFGSQRQASEKRAAAIGLENLARTAGYADPIRLEWAMEARGVADLADGPLTVSAGDVTVSLALNRAGEAELSITRDGKPLKALPAALKKDPDVAALRARLTDLKRQASRMRLSLEQAMCRGDAFTSLELRELCAHPLLAPLLERLVLVGEESAGYPVEGGRALRDDASAVRALAATERLRIAHPHDLLASGAWQEWQRECFRDERVQPFKQVFRELYVLTAAERAEGTLSRRYAGHQVQPRQALALLGSRGWVSHPEEGVRRTFHDLNLTAWITFLEGTWTPAEVEGVTLEGVGFSRRGEWQPLDLAEIPPRVFSEVMRDLDLVVSVAHRGGVDPEASASTVEMRAALLQETCRLLRLANVRVQGAHVLIEGKVGRYSVHLGSAVVHRQPGGALCIVPVHAQHRGRLFLPFADDDPKTAELLAKVLLLARDDKIRDPSILEQLRAA